MGRLEGRIKKLEARAEAAKITEEARQQRECAEVVSHLSSEDLRVLIDALDTAIDPARLPSGPSGEDSGAFFEELYASADERGRRALDAYTQALAALRRGEELPPAPLAPLSKGN